MWNLDRPWRLLCGMLVISLVTSMARAEPYLATRMGLKCVACHVNPTGGGLRNDYGIVFASTQLPAKPLAADQMKWTGKVSDLIRIGGDLRASAAQTEFSNDVTQHRIGLDQARLYADLTLIPQRLGLYVDEYVGPDAAQAMEAYVRYGDTASGWYLKGGKFYLPFGWRLQDTSTFVQGVAGISMLLPDSGVELGWEAPQWSGQLDLSQGVGPPQIDPRYRATGQLAWIQAGYRVGVAASFSHAGTGNRDQGGIFGGLRTGPVAWLAEVDAVRDDTFPGGTQKFLGGLAEANWEVRRGHNLKLTADYFDPNRDVGHDGQTRWSVLYEFTPLPFVQLRAGYRDYEDIPANSIQLKRVTFLELHGFF